jgi:transposase-like protein
MRKQYTSTQKAKIVLEVLKEAKTITQIASEHGVHPSQLCRWRDKAVEHLAELFEEQSDAGPDKTAEHQAETERLYAEIGRLTTQLSWLKKKSGLTTEQE